MPSCLIVAGSKAWPQTLENVDFVDAQNSINSMYVLQSGVDVEESNIPPAQNWFDIQDSSCFVPKCCAGNKSRTVRSSSNKSRGSDVSSTDTRKC